MNKRGAGDYPILVFVVILVALLFLAPILLKILNNLNQPLQDMANNTGIQQNRETVSNLMSLGTGVWDSLNAILFIALIIVLIVSTIFIDAHPIFLIIFILLASGTVIIAVNLMNAVDQIYNDPNYALEVSQLTFTNYVRNHVIEILMVTIVLIMIILYGKYRSRQEGALM